MPRVSMDMLKRARAAGRGKGRAAAGAGRPSTAPARPPAAVPVRVIPPGSSGEDLPRVDLAALRVGSIWRRGCQRVRIRSVNETDVQFTELNHGGNKRRVPVALFLRNARPEPAGE